MADSQRAKSNTKDKTGEPGILEEYCLLWTLKGHNGNIDSVVLSPDSKLLASSSRDGIIKVWDACSGMLLHSLEGNARWVTAMACCWRPLRAIEPSRSGTQARGWCCTRSRDILAGWAQWSSRRTAGYWCPPWTAKPSYSGPLMHMLRHKRWVNIVASSSNINLWRLLRMIALSSSRT